MTDSFTQLLIDSASEPYQQADKFGRHFARGKLTADPFFAAIFKYNLIPDHQRLLDLGCGQGLLAAWLVAAQALFNRGCWTDTWSPPPKVGQIEGIDLMPRDIARAKRALGEQAQFRVGNICEVEFLRADVIVLMDVLHYLNYEDQERLLQKIRAAITAEGVFITRIGDTSAGLPCLFSQWVDGIAAFARGHQLPKFHCRSLSQWQELLTAQGFSTQTMPMSEGTLFANTLIIATLNPLPSITDIQKS
jgi:SAM-dependent methyltransferase